MVLRLVALFVVMNVVLLTTIPHSTDIMRSAKFWRRVSHDPQIYLIVLVSIWLLIWIGLRMKYERLYVGADSLRYVSPLRGPFRFLEAFHPGWSVPWTELRRAELQVQSLGLGKRRYTLVLSTASRSRTLEWPQSWQQASSQPDSPALSPRRDEAAMRRAIMQSSLVQALRAHGVEVVDLPGLVRPKGALKGYDIAQDKRLLIAVALLLIALVYYFGDTFIEWPYMAVENVPVWPYVIVGFSGLWLGYDLGKNAPRMERILISIMLAGSLCAACYPLMLRLNALTAPPGEDLYTYTQVRPGYFKPPRADLPWIYFDYQPAYWLGLPAGGTHQFRIMKGVLGFYEVDTTRVQDEVRAWWGTQKFR